MNYQVRRPSLEALFREVDNFSPKKEKLQPPRIGISSNRKDGLSCIADTYVQSVLKAGGAPVLIPVITDMEALTAIVSGLDGLLMGGGGELIEGQALGLWQLTASYPSWVFAAAINLST